MTIKDSLGLEVNSVLWRLNVLLQNGYSVNLRNGMVYYSESKTLEEGEPSEVVSLIHTFKKELDIFIFKMLRLLNKKGIVLIEPADQYVDSTILQIPFRNLKNYLRKKLKNRSIRNDFETSGNYVYRLSKREIEKLAYGLSLKTIAFYGMNDYFIPGIGTTKIDKPSKGFSKLKAVIKLQDILCSFGLLKPSILIAVIFKENVDDHLKQTLKKHNFEVIDLEKNPYLE